MTRWTERQVLESAPDQSSVAAARRLARPGPWSGTGSTDTLDWGRCQGSGATPYQVSVDLSGPAYRCSCPSRKFPCKHALALLLMWVQGDDGPAGTTASPEQSEAQARRREARLALMEAGVEDFRARRRTRPTGLDRARLARRAGAPGGRRHTLTGPSLSGADHPAGSAGPSQRRSTGRVGSGS